MGLEALLSNSFKVGASRAESAKRTAFASLASIEHLPDVGIFGTLMLPGLVIGSSRRTGPQPAGSMSETLEGMFHFMQQHRELSGIRVKHEAVA